MHEYNTRFCVCCANKNTNYWSWHCEHQGHWCLTSTVCPHVSSAGAVCWMWLRVMSFVSVKWPHRFSCLIAKGHQSEWREKHHTAVMVSEPQRRLRSLLRSVPPPSKPGAQGTRSTFASRCFWRRKSSKKKKERKMYFNIQILIQQIQFDLIQSSMKQLLVLVLVSDANTAEWFYFSTLWQIVWWCCEWGEILF